MDYELKKAVGLNFIINELSPDSPFGTEKIKNMDVYKSGDKEKLLECYYNLNALINYLEENSIDALRRLLMRFKNIRNALKKCQLSYLSEIELFEMKNFLLTFYKFIQEFKIVNDICRFKNVYFTETEDALDILDPDKKRTAPFSISEKYTQKLWEIRLEKAKIEGLLHTETERPKIERLQIERSEIVALEEAEETEIKKDLSRKLTPFIPTLFENIDNLGKLDFLIQKALLAIKYKAVCPEITDQPRLMLENMLNPEIASILRLNGKSFAKVSIELGKGTAIITGANMGGKSVAVKTAVLNVLLSRLGFYVFCDYAKIPLFDDVFLISEDLQSVSKGLSTFGAEIVRFNEIINKSKTAFSLIALDEFARGTNPEEGAIIVKAVATYLNSQNGIAVITTHYDNVVSSEFKHYQVAGLKDLNLEALSDHIRKNPLNGIDYIAEHMDYRLVKTDGKQDPPRDALNICKILALDNEILEKIETMYKQ